MSERDQGEGISDKWKKVKEEIKKFLNSNSLSRFSSPPPQDGDTFDEVLADTPENPYREKNKK
jgi:hypothetical protein